MKKECKNGIIGVGRSEMQIRHRRKAFFSEPAYCRKVSEASVKTVYLNRFGIARGATVFFEAERS